MKQYLDLLEEVLNFGVEKPDRTGTGTLSVFGPQVTYDLNDGFPLVTTKKVFTKGIIEELLWFLSGDNKVKTLKDKGVHIWDSWELKDGTIGAGYPVQWRRVPRIVSDDLRSDCRIMLGKLPNGREFSYFKGSGYYIEWIDQVSDLIKGIKEDPHGRRHIVTAWNPSEIEDMALPPCHTFWQLYVRGEYIDLKLYQRSADLFIGVPFNIASYSLLLMMIAQVTGYKPGKFIHTFGDAHIYKNHIDQVKEQLTREPKKLPTVELNKDINNIFDFKYEDITIRDYEPWPAIKAPVAV